ncbi:N-acetylmuramoyl-L-alanine amidase [Streptomyces smaragdinus]|uniref:N-acetylmuramoyl-L-alanine amidase n=1 Tax=Streptomyces smaragdinus TaxID=2585196 RepID=UPI002B218D05|nr:N-acetylmuramoyl-L-alanine amidase [Streptomyces smaragdinus]
MPPLLAVALAAAGLLAPSAPASAATTERGDDFSLVGVSWPASAGPLPGTPQVRTRDAKSGDWSAWRTLESSPQQTEEGARARARRSTEPLWAGPSTAAQARLRHTDGTVSALPANARLELVSPGPQPARTATPYLERTPLAASGVPQPSIRSRASWGADESLRPDPPEYGTSVKAFFVHHTVDSNSYSCSEAPAIIRAIYRYHVRTNGWNDIGYNFLIDKCGQIYEGRYGGITRPVIGAHSMGFNTNTAGAAVIGDYSSAAVPEKVTAAFSRLAAWKLGLSGVKSTSKVTLTAGVDNGTYKKGQTVSLYRVSAHRNVYATACPGAKLYAKVATIRTYAADSAAPTFTKGPDFWARKGYVQPDFVPVQLYWNAHDDTGVRYTSSVSPRAESFSGSTTSWNTGVKPAVSTTWTMKTVDWVNRVANGSKTRTGTIVQETAAARTGTWKVKSSTSYLGGKSLTSSSTGASLSWTFTGTSVGWVVSRASGSGQAAVYLDGVKKATVDLKSSAVAYRYAIWAAHWSTAGTHKLTIKVVGTSGRPTITTDGITVVR